MVPSTGRTRIMRDEIKSVYKSVGLSAVVAILCFSGLVFFYDKLRAPTEVGEEYKRYLEVQREYLESIERSVGELSNLEDELNNVRRELGELETRIFESRDYSTGIGITNDQSQRIIAELQKRAREGTEE